MSATPTLTLARPTTRRNPSAPSIGRPAATFGVLAAIGVSGALRLLPVPDSIAGPAIFSRSGAAPAARFVLGEGITCWLDREQQGGTGVLNWVATGMCMSLSGGAFVGTDDAPFVCGLALFAGAGTSGAVGLSEAQLRRVVDAHAVAEETADGAYDPCRADAAADFTHALLATA